MTTEDPPRWLTGASDAPQELVALVAADDSMDGARLLRVAERLGATLGDASLSLTLKGELARAAVTKAGWPLWSKLLVLTGVLGVGVGLGVVGLNQRGGGDLATQTPPRARSAPLPTLAEPSKLEAIPPPSATPPSAGAGARMEAKSASRTPPGADAAREVVMLERARRELARDPSAALKLTVQHARRFPEGLLVQEREMIAIDALLRLDLKPAAELRARTFVSRFPTSGHAPRLQQLLGSGKP